jgi:phosphate transport system ATP-binding protein
MSAIIEARNFCALYGHRRALADINLLIERNEIFGIIGPAGGGKTTFLRCLNRMNDLVPGFETTGTLTFEGVDLYRERVDVPVLRRKLGMVFATPVPLPGTIYQNLALGPKFVGKRAVEERMERSLRAAYLWDEVKDRMQTSAFALSGGQQQRLCLARTLMLEPDVLLLDEPCSGLDPISTAKIEEALEELKKELTVVLVTNNVMQASRVADRTALFLQGRLVEHGETEQIFVNPKEKVTLEYVSGRFG